MWRSTNFWPLRSIWFVLVLFIYNPSNAQVESRSLTNVHLVLTAQSSPVEILNDKKLSLPDTAGLKSEHIKLIPSPTPFTSTIQYTPDQRFLKRQNEGSPITIEALKLKNDTLQNSSMKTIIFNR